MADEEYNQKMLTPKQELDFQNDKAKDIFENNLNNKENMPVTQLKEEESDSLEKKSENYVKMVNYIDARKRKASSLNNNNSKMRKIGKVLRPLENLDNSTIEMGESIFQNLFSKRAAANIRIDSNDNAVVPGVIEESKTKINSYPLKPLSVSRDARIQIQEQKGIIEFQVVSKSLKKKPNENNYILIGLQSVFGNELFAMPKKYISTTMFDGEHKCLALVKKHDVIGGICFKLFPSQGFAEIVFCAIAFKEQNKGYGSRLMKQFKDYIISEGIQNLLTYADNNAIEYFKKQGFTDDIKLDTKLYGDHIKEYYEATLMQCELHLKVVKSETIQE